jgi:hypothetical protein
MKNDINPPAVSKINWTALVMALIGVGAALGVIPEELKEPVTEAALIIGPMLVATFRTWFTKP